MIDISVEFLRELPLKMCLVVTFKILIVTFITEDGLNDEMKLESALIT